MPLYQLDEQRVVIHFIKLLRYINCTHVDCRTRTDIMINHTSDNTDSLSTTRLLFEPKTNYYSVIIQCSSTGTTGQSGLT